MIPKSIYLFASKNLLVMAPINPLITIRISTLAVPVTKTKQTSIAMSPIRATIKTSIAQTNRSLGGTLRVRFLDFALRVVSWAIAKGLSSMAIYFASKIAANKAS